jgi:hypothetical protein
MVVVLLVQAKCPGVEQVDFGIPQIALERLRTRCRPQTTKIGGLCSRNHAYHAVG